MSRYRIQVVFFACILFFGMTSPARAGLAERLMRLLVEKGVVTEEEAQELRRELEAEGEDPPASVKQTQEEEVSGEEAPTYVEPELEKKFLSVGDRIEFSGDFRLRYDGQFRDLSTESYARHRSRFRLRLGVEAEIAPPLEVGFRLATGSGVQNTTNQTFDEHGRGKNIFVDRAYVSWAPKKWLTVLGGRHRNPFLTRSLTWDSDVNLEGVAEQLRYDGENLRVFGNFSQFFVEELNLRSSDADPLMLGYQGGARAQAGSNIFLTLAATYYDFRNLDLLSPGGLFDSDAFVGFNNDNHQQMVFDQSGRLLNEFDVLELNGELSLTGIAPAPLTFFGSYLNNFSADVSELQSKGAVFPGSDPGALAAYGDDDRSSGFQLGLNLGYEGHKGDWQLGYLYQVLEDYAFPAVFADSDFHGGGTNNRGHNASIGYFFTDRVFAEGNFFFTKRDQEAKDGVRDENRVQVDLIFDF